MTISFKEREILRKNIQNMIVKNEDIKDSQIVNHFSQEGYARRTIYNNIKRIRQRKPIKQKNIGYKSKKWTALKSAKLKKAANNRVGISLRKLGRKFSVHHTTIHRKLKKVSINYQKRIKTPKYTEETAKKSKKRSRKLVNNLYGKDLIVIMDDEKYFRFSCDQLPGNSGFYTDDKAKCPDSVKYKGKEKYPKQLLVWIAISEKGISKPLIRCVDAPAINQDIYLNECLVKRLMPFIHEHHSDVNYIFWPDLASSHYANKVVSWMDENINYVHKDMNPPNVPQARPIENFWGYLSQKVYEGGWEAKTEHQLKLRINAKLKEIDLNLLQSMMKGVKTKLRKIADSGVFALSNDTKSK